MDFREFLKNQFEPFLADEKEIDMYHHLGRYFEGVTGKYDLNKGLFVNGVVGAGKTELFYLANKYPGMKKQIPVISCRKVVEFYENGVNTSPYYIKEYCFDDLGTEDRSNRYGKDSEMFSAIIEERYKSWKHEGTRSHFTTNLSGSDIKEKYGIRAYDRLVEMCNSFKHPATDSKRGKSKLLAYDREEKQPTPYEIEMQKIEAHKGLMDKMAIIYNDCRETKFLNWSINGGVIFDVAEERGIIVVAPEDRKKAWQDAKEWVKKKGCEDKADSAERSIFKDYLQDALAPGNKYKFKSINKAKTLLLERWFVEMIKMDFDLKGFIEEKFKEWINEADDKL